MWRGATGKIIIIIGNGRAMGRAMQCNARHSYARAAEVVCVVCVVLTRAKHVRINEYNVGIFDGPFMGTHRNR